jgi:tetratricopeptide (TPR) repeat protein
LEYDPGSAYAYRGLGRIQFKSGAFDEAARMYENAILHSRGGMMEAFNDACLSHLRAGAFDKALERCHAGLMRAPEEAVLMTNTARVYLALGKMNEAIHWARLGHQKKPLQFYPLWHLLLVTLESGDRPATELLWIKVKKQKPGDKTLLQFARQFGFE